MEPHAAARHGRAERSSKSLTSQLVPHLAAAGVVAAAAVLLTALGEPTDATTMPSMLRGNGSAIRVMIDPGHGGTDSGAVGNGLVEKELNLAVGLRLRELLELDTTDMSGGGEWEVRMTRDNDASVSLGGRTTQANNWPADRFVSIHHNAFSSSLANGTETFSFANGTFSANLRDRIQEELLIGLGLFNRGSKTANFFVLRNTSMPAALSEGGFLTSPIDSGVLSTADAIENSAQAHLFGIQRHYGITAYLPSDGPTSYCVAKRSSAGCLPAIESSGTPSLSSGDFAIECRDVLSNQFGLMIWARSADSSPFFGATLCLGGTLYRTPVSNSNGLGNFNCSGRLTLNMDSQFMQQSGFQAGEEIFAQWIFRDPFYAPFDPVGLSDGLRFTVLP